MNEIVFDSSTIVITERSSIRVSGISSVDSFDSIQISASTCNGEILVIDGDSLTVKDVNLDKGILEAEGKINGVNYYERNPAKRSFGIKGLFGSK